MNDAELKRWRDQLAAEEAEDSEDEGVGGYGAQDVQLPPDQDLGLALEEPMHIPGKSPRKGVAGDIGRSLGVAGGGGPDPLDMYAGMPRRAGQAPPGPPRPIPPKFTPASGSEDPQILMHKLHVLELKLEEREIELEAARMSGGGGGGGGAGMSDAREAKMKELARRAKAATMALGRERAKTAQLASELASLKQQQQQQQGPPQGGGGGGPSVAGNGAVAAGALGGGAAARLEAAAARVGEAREGISSQDRERELKELRERLTATDRRLHETKIAVQSSKQELERYQRALKKEVGEDVSVAKLLDEASGAKGRAQQIALLNDKVKALTRRLQSLDPTEEGGGAGGPGSPGSERDRGDERQRGALQKMDHDRHRELERLLLREQELSAEVVDSRKKSEAMGARIRNLELDVRGKKEKLKTLLDKSDADDQLVEALRTELDKFRKGGGGAGGGAGVGAGVGAGGGMVGAAEDATQKKRMIELASRAAQQQTQIDRQEQIILALRDQMQQLQQKLQQKPPPPPEQRPPQDLIKLQTENSKLRELVALLQEKLADAADTY